MKIKNIAKLFVVLYVYDRQSRACLYTHRIRVASYVLYVELRNGYGDDL